MHSISIGLFVQFLYLVRYIQGADDIEKHRNINLLPKDCGLSYTDRIIGGTQSQLGQYPWLVRIGYIVPGCITKIIYKCGGALINDRYVITAAHCATDLPKIKCLSKSSYARFELGYVLIGEYDSRTNPDCAYDVCAEAAQVLKASTVIVHELYNKPMYANDIALVGLQKKVHLNEWVSPICLPRGEQLSKDYMDKIAIVAGWGTTNISYPHSSAVPMFVKVPIVKVEKCYKSFGVGLTLYESQQICAGGEENKDSCGGDSGGPLMFVEAYNGPPRYYAIGLVSFGVDQCGKKGKSAIYTRLAAYMNWILDHMVP